MKKTIDIGIPIYNEGDIVLTLYNRIISSIAKVKTKYSFNLLFVNDGSTDNTSNILKNLSKKDKKISTITFSRNFGLEAAISCILNESKSDALIIMDGDLQDPPELIPDLISKWEKGFDVVYTVKKSRKEFILKKFLFSLFYKIQRLIVNIEMPGQAGNFSLIDKQVVSSIKSLSEKNKYFPGLRAWCGYNQTGIYYDRDKRFHGKPKMNLFKLTNLAFNGIFSYTKIPQRFAYIISLFFIIIGFIYTIYVFISKFLLHIGPVGWASTIMTIYLIGGFQIFIIALLGEYIIRIFDDTRKRPEYIIKEKTNKKRKSP